MGWLIDEAFNFLFKRTLVEGVLRICKKLQNIKKNINLIFLCMYFYIGPTVLNIVDSQLFELITTMILENSEGLKTQNHKQQKPKKMSLI